MERFLKWIVFQRQSVVVVVVVVVVVAIPQRDKLLVGLFRDPYEGKTSFERNALPI